MKNHIKRFLAFALALALFWGLLPAGAVRAEASEAAEPAQVEEQTAPSKADYAEVDAIFEQIDAVEAAPARKSVNQAERTEAAMELVMASDSYVEDSLVQSGLSFTWWTDSGIRCIYNPRMREKRNHMTPEAGVDAIVNEPVATKSGTPASKQVYLVGPYYGYDDNFTDQYQNEAQRVASAIGDPDGYTLYSGAAATVDKVAEAVSNGAVVFFDSHGATDYENPYNKLDCITGASGSWLCITSSEGLTDADYADGAAYGGEDSFINGDVIANHMTTASPNGMLWMAICFGMGTDTMYRPLREKGVAVVYGYSESVTFDGDYLFEEAFWSEMIQGKTVAQSIAAMKNTWGEWDLSTQISSHCNYSTSYSTISDARAAFTAFPQVVSDEDSHPGQRTGNTNYGADSLQTVQATYALEIKNAGSTTIVADGTCGENLTWTLDSAGTLTISGTGLMEDYSGWGGAPWGEQKQQIIRVVLEPGVSTIGNEAFYDCTGLTQITIPDSVYSIGERSFRNCRSLIAIAIPEGVTAIREGAFENCESLVRVTIPDSVYSIGNYSFGNCRSLIAITIPEGVTAIREGAFENCVSLTDITLPSSVSAVGGRAFAYCGALSKVTIPEGVATIGDYAFDSCVSLTAIALPNSLSSIGEGAFLGCRALSGITIPVKITVLRNNLFENCSSLTTVILPDGITVIGEGAFRYCKVLRNITLPNSVAAIGYEAFLECKSLSEIALSASLTVISEAAFRYCEGLTTVKLPVSVLSVGYDAFYGCWSITDVYYNGTAAAWEKIAINSGNDNLVASNIHTRDSENLVMDQRGNFYQSMAEALENADRLVLLQNIDGAFTVNKNVTLDLNGFTVSGAVTVKNGAVLTVKDSQTDDYTVKDEAGYGKLVKVTGTVVAADGYLQITETGGMSFHKVTLDLTSITLRSQDVGIYYNGEFFCDEVAASNVDRFGIALRLGNAPTAAYMESSSAYSWYQGLKAGAAGNTASGTLLKNIMADGCTTQENAERAQSLICGSAYILTKDGRYLFSDSESFSLIQIVQKVDARWMQLSNVQKNAIMELYNRFEDVISNWHLPHINESDIVIPI